MIQVVCGKGATAVIAPDGRMMVAGDNSHNRLGLDTDNIDTFTPVLTHLPPIRDISISGHCSLVLTRTGEVYRVGGDTRTVTRLDLGLDTVVMVAALTQVGLVLTDQGTLHSVTFKQGNKKQVEFVDDGPRMKKPLRIEKNDKNSCLIHFQLLN